MFLPQTASSKILSITFGWKFLEFPLTKVVSSSRSSHSNKDTNGTYKHDKLISITTADIFVLKCECLFRITVNGTRKQALNCFRSDVAT